MILLFTQCEGWQEGYWSIQFQNVSDQKIIFYLDVIEDDGFYARESYYDPSDNFLKFGQEFPANMENPDEYILPYLPVHIDYSDIISVYAVHPDTLAKYSWSEIKQTKNYWFARILIQREDIAIYFPFELNRLVEE